MAMIGGQRAAHALGKSLGVDHVRHAEFLLGVSLFKMFRLQPN